MPLKYKCHIKILNPIRHVYIICMLGAQCTLKNDTWIFLLCYIWLNWWSGCEFVTKNWSYNKGREKRGGKELSKQCLLVGIGCIHHIWCGVCIDPTNHTVPLVFGPFWRFNTKGGKLPCCVGSNHLATWSQTNIELT